MNKENLGTLNVDTSSASSDQAAPPNELSKAKGSGAAAATASAVPAVEKTAPEIVEPSGDLQASADASSIAVQASESESTVSDSPVAESPIADSPIVESPIDLQTLNSPSSAPMRAAADLLQQASLALLQEAGNDAEAETPAKNTRFVLRRGKLSEEQIAARKDRVGAIRQKTLRAVRENGAGQALAWLESKSQEEDVALLRDTLCAALSIPNDAGSLLRSYSELDSVSAVLFRERLVSSLNGLTLEVE